MLHLKKELKIIETQILWWKTSKQQQQKNADKVDENIKLCFCLELAPTEPWYNMLQTLNFRDTEKYEVVSFFQTDRLEVKESTKRSQISNFLVS